MLSSSRGRGVFVEPFLLLSLCYVFLRRIRNCWGGSAPTLNFQFSAIYSEIPPPAPMFHSVRIGFHCTSFVLNRTCTIFCRGQFIEVFVVNNQLSFGKSVFVLVHTDAEISFELKVIARQTVDKVNTHDLQRCIFIILTRWLRSRNYEISGEVVSIQRLSARIVSPRSSNFTGRRILPFSEQ